MPVFDVELVSLASAANVVTVASDAPPIIPLVSQTHTVEPIPFAVQAALVEAAGRAFWLWDAYAHYLRGSGVPPAVVQRLVASGRESQSGKFRTTRELLLELDDAGAAGRAVQVAMVRSLVALQIDDALPEATAARAAQSRLRASADEHGLLSHSRAHDEHAAERLAARRRREARERDAKDEAERARKRAELRREFASLVGEPSDKQGRGYRLETLFGEIARLDGLRWTPPFRKGTVDQTDGLLVHENWRYLVEARWRMKPPDVAACAALAHKASRRLESTRGLFISIEGFRDEVVGELERGDKNLLLLSGQELALILEGHVTLALALQLKHDEAAKRGTLFYDVAAPSSA